MAIPASRAMTVFTSRMLSTIRAVEAGQSPPVRAAHTSAIGMRTEPKDRSAASSIAVRAVKDMNSILLLERIVA